VRVCFCVSALHLTRRANRCEGGAGVARRAYEDDAMLVHDLVCEVNEPAWQHVPIVLRRWQRCGWARERGTWHPSRGNGSAWALSRGVWACSALLNAWQPSQPTPTSPAAVWGGGWLTKAHVDQVALHACEGWEGCGRVRGGGQQWGAKQGRAG